MGHDIYAYAREYEDEVAHLRGNHGIYEALDAGVSGNNDGRWFTRQEIVAALDRLAAREASDRTYEGLPFHPAERFLRECLDRVPNEDGRLFLYFT